MPKKYIEIDARSPTEEEQELKRQAKTQLENLRGRLIINQPFLGLLALKLEIVPVKDSRCPTAATDGRRIYFNIDFLAEMKDEQECIFVIAHEIWHCALRHLGRQKGRMQQLFNIAADLEIKFLLKKDGFTIPEWHKFFPDEDKLDGQNMESIYDYLLQNMQKANGQDSFDTHDWQRKQGDQQGQGQGQGQGQKEEGQDQEGEDGNQQTNGEGGGQDFVIDSDYNPSVDGSVERDWHRHVANTAMKVRRHKGKLPSHIQSIVEWNEKPQINWKRQLQQFVTQCYGGSRQWLPPNRRHVWQGMYLPSRRDQQIKLVLGIDTSGSTTNDLPDFLTELMGLIRAFGRYELTVLHCDAAVAKVEEFTPEHTLDPKSFKFHGGGGTSFRPVFEYVKTKMRSPDLLIYFTDGYGDAPPHPPGYPVLWVLTHDHQNPASWGYKAVLDERRNHG